MDHQQIGHNLRVENFFASFLCQVHARKSALKRLVEGSFEDLDHADQVRQVEHFGQFEEFEALVQSFEMLKKQGKRNKCDQINPKPKLNVAFDDFFSTRDILVILVKVDSIEINQNVHKKNASDQHIIDSHSIKLCVKKAHFHRQHYTNIKQAQKYNLVPNDARPAVGENQAFARFLNTQIGSVFRVLF